MESTNISTKKQKPFTINLTVGMSFIGVLSCFLGVLLIFQQMTTAEFLVSAILYIVMGILFAIVMVLGGLPRHRNTSKLPFIYGVLLLIALYIVIRLIFVLSELGPRLEAIANNTVDYTTETARLNAAEELKRKTWGIVAFGIIAFVGVGANFFFATKKALDGESRWPYTLAFAVALLFTYLMAYSEVNFLNSVSNMTPYFFANFNESRTCAVALVMIHVISVVNDYDPDQDPAMIMESPHA